LAEIEAESAGDVVAQESAKRGMNSTLTQARSCFSRHALDDLHDLGMPPGVKDFAESLKVKARVQEEPVQLTEAQMNEILAALPALKLAKPAVWVGFQLMLYGGLRNIDCLHARRSWLDDEGDIYRLKLRPFGDYMPKGKSGGVVFFKDHMDQILSLSEPSGFEPVELTANRYLVPASSPTARENALYRDLNAWLRGLGVGEESNKVAYRLRKKFLAILNDQQGREMARIAARHASQATTDSHYIGAPRMSQPITIGVQAVG
jgi:integrase